MALLQGKSMRQVVLPNGLPASLPGEKQPFFQRTERPDYNGSDKDKCDGYYGAADRVGSYQ